MAFGFGQRTEHCCKYSDFKNDYLKKEQQCIAQNQKPYVYYVIGYLLLTGKSMPIAQLRKSHI